MTYRLVKEIADIDFNKFKVKSQITKGYGQWCVKILYGGETFKVQAPQMKTTFDLLGYTYPNMSTKRYSLAVTLDDKDPDIKAFIDLLEEIDYSAKNTARNEFFTQEELDTLVYNSPIKTPEDKKYLPHLRCKMVSNATRFKFKCWINKKEITPWIEDMEKLLKRNRKVDMILQLNPIWKNEREYGVSWQIIGLNIIDERDLQFDFQQTVVNENFVGPTSPRKWTTNEINEEPRTTHDQLKLKKIPKDSHYVKVDPNDPTNTKKGKKLTKKEQEAREQEEFNKDFNDL